MKAASGTSPNCCRTLSKWTDTLVIVEGVGDLVHNEVGVPEKAMDAVVEVDANIILVLLEAEMPKIEVFEPVIVQLCRNCCLC